MNYESKYYSHMCDKDKDNTWGTYMVYCLTFVELKKIYLSLSLFSIRVQWYSPLYGVFSYQEVQLLRCIYNTGPHTPIAKKSNGESRQNINCLYYTLLRPIYMYSRRFHTYRTHLSPLRCGCALLRTLSMM